MILYDRAGLYRPLAHKLEAPSLLGYVRDGASFYRPLNFGAENTRRYYLAHLLHRLLIATTYCRCQSDAYRILYCVGIVNPSRILILWNQKSRPNHKLAPESKVWFLG